MDRPRSEALALLRGLGVLRARREELLSKLLGLFACFETRFRDRFRGDARDPFASEKEHMAILMELVADVERRWTALRTSRRGDSPARAEGPTR
jgi:hypothetical protein